MQEEANLEQMWSAHLRSLPKSKAEFIEMESLYMYRLKVPGICGGSFELEYIGNKGTRAIVATVQTRVIYRGRDVFEEPKDILVKPGKANEVDLGCTGFLNPTGADHTEYSRLILGARWE